MLVTIAQTRSSVLVEYQRIWWVSEPPRFSGGGSFFAFLKNHKSWRFTPRIKIWF